MKSETILRSLIGCQLLWLVAIALTAPAEPTYESELGLMNALSLIYVLTYCVSLFLLFKYNGAGRTLFFASCILGIPLTLASPEYSVPVSNSYELLIWLGGVLDGVMLVMMYLTDLKYRFKANTQSTVP